MSAHHHILNPYLNPYLNFGISNRIKTVLSHSAIEVSFSVSKLVGTLKLGAIFEKIIFQVTQKSSLHFEKVLVAKFVVKFVQKFFR